jgi:hypothetical protein
VFRGTFPLLPTPADGVEPLAGELGLFAGGVITGAVTVGVGVAGAEAVDELLVPALFVAVAVNVYAVLLVNPVIVHEPLAPFTVHVAPPGLAVTV